MGQDARYALRLLAKRPASTIAAILSLALAVGANVAIFTLIDRVVLHPLDVPEPSRLVTPLRSFKSPDGSEFRTQGFLYNDYLRSSKASSTLSAVAGFSARGLVPVSFPDGTALARPLFVSANYFSVLGVPSRGRVFDVAEDADEGELVVLLSDRTWQRHFGADPGVIGRQITVSAVSATVIGIAPKEFAGTQLSGDPPELFLPLKAVARVTNPSNYFGVAGTVVNGSSAIAWVNIVGRLRPGATADQARAEMGSFFSKNPRDTSTVSVVPLEDTVVPFDSQRDLFQFASLLAAVVGLTLLIGCANLASLLLARVEERRAELALRSALGAGRGRLMRQLAMETGVLAVFGGVAALVVARWIVSALSTFKLPGSIAIAALRAPFDARAFFFAFAATVVAALLFGVAPVIGGARRDLLIDLKRQSGRTTLRVGASRLLVGVQVAVCLVLIVAAGLFLRSLAAGLATDLGFDPRGVIIANTTPDRQRFDAASTDRYAQALLERIRVIPGVADVALGLSPLAGGTFTTQMASVDGINTRVSGLVVNYVGSGYFRALRQPVLSGREFSPADAPGSPAVIVITEATARQLWPEQNPLGHRLALPPTHDESEVVGVVRDTKPFTLRDQNRLSVYYPRAQTPTAFTSLVVRTSSDTASVIGAMHRAAADINSQLPLRGVQTIDDRVAELLMPQRLGASLLTLLGILAVTLTLVGVYGLIACVVTRSTRDIGVRIALGASPTTIVRATLRYAFLPVVCGIVIGSIAAWWGGRFADRFMYGITGTDLATLGLAVALLVVAALAAALIPARRAMRVNPIEALRAE